MALVKSEVVGILKAAMSAPYVPGRGCGCGRAYVTISEKLARGEVKMMDEACKEVGLMFLRKAYGTFGNTIYIGYDNSDGRALAKAEAMAEVMRAKGLKCYVDAVAD